MISDTITVNTYRIWDISVSTAKLRKHILQLEASLARAKVTQSGRRTVARAHFLITVGVNGHNESVDDFLSIFNQLRGASPGRSERRLATQCLFLVGAVSGQESETPAIKAGTLVI